MNFIIYFFVYSVGGFLIETVYTRIVDGKCSVRRSMLYSPMCIVYGIGGAALAAAVYGADVPAAVIFVFGFAVCSAVEYGVSLLYEKLCGVLLWDYSDMRANVNGRVCARYSLYWGFVSVMFCRYIHPGVKFMTESMNVYLKIMICVIFTMFFMKDLKITLHEMKKCGKGEKSMCDGVLEYILPAPERKIF